jgi:hypothetical protein
MKSETKMTDELTHDPAREKVGTTGEMPKGTVGLE